MVLELGSMGSKRRRLELVEITIGIEIFRETITELKLSVEDNTLKAERRMEKKKPVISETLTREWHQPSDWESKLIPICGFYTATRRFKMQHLD